MTERLTVFALFILFCAFISLQVVQHRNFENGSLKEAQHSQARIDANILIKEALR